MARIKVTGYLDTEDMEPDHVDLGHPMGVSDDFYMAILSGGEPLPPLDEIEFEKVAD